MPIPANLAPVMKLFPRLAATSLEPLESRIAPARIIITGVPNAIGVDVDYTDTDPGDQLFVNTETGITQSDQISTAVGPGVVAEADTFYIKLFAGDVLKLFNSTTGPDPYIEVHSGNLVAFFLDRNRDNEVAEDELTGVALGKNVSVTFHTSIDGDIVTNLNEQGDTNEANDTLDMTGLISGKQGIKSLSMGGGNVDGKIIAGGKITNLDVGTVGGILAGSAVNNTDANTNALFPLLNATPDGIADGFTTIDFYPGVDGGHGNVSFAPGVGVNGASIEKITVANVLTRIEAGGGGEGAKGGSLKQIEIVADADGAILLAGAGGDAGSVNKNGGAGGKIKKVVYAAPDGGDLTANSAIVMRAGAGGDATTGKAGKGGAASDVLVGFKLISGKPFGTAQLVQDNVTVAGGAGGSAKVGGAGGDVTNSIVQTITPDQSGDELQILGGAGGNSTALAGGKTGAGGAVREVSVLNQRNGVSGGVLIEGGDAGSGVGADKGANGGSLSGLRVLATNVKVFAGNGSAGSVGGNGGGLEGLDIDSVQGIFSRNATINAGFGGVGAAGKGGNGGNIGGVRIDDGDFTTININEGIFGDGGDGANGKGGKGGSIERVDIFERDLAIGANNGTFTLRTGTGGDGSAGGGAGGSLRNVRFAAVGMDANVFLGDGGDATGVNAKGKGGKGGGANSVEVQADGTVNTVPAHSSVLAGTGGDGAGTNGAGGNGGGLEDVSLRSEGAVRLEAGDGGNGTTGRPGAGGSIFTSGAFANVSTGTLIAGDAGARGAGPANGGSVVGNASNLAGLYAQTDITVRGGDGSHGGAGGSLKFVGYGSTSSTLVPTPNGAVTIEAGDGSVDGTFAGKGGIIKSVSGAVSSGIGELTLVRAGTGGSAFAQVDISTIIDGNGAQAEIQNIDLSALADSPRATFVLTYANGATQPLPVVPSAVQTPAVFADLIESAINQLPGIGAGGVNVTPILDGSGNYTNQLVVTFSAVGPRDQLAGLATLGTVAGAGGSIKSLILERGGAKDGVVVIEAGHGGDTPGAKGAKGGSVEQVSVANVDPLLTLRSIAAGDGGDGANKGAPGGSITAVDVLGLDIGVREGVNYGYDTMGGLFAGAGGIATRNGAQALPGSVTQITAESIAAIVAGRGAIPQAVDRVADIYLSGFEAIKDSTSGLLHAFPNTAVIATFNGENSLPITGPILPDTPPMPANDGPLDDALLDDAEDILNAMLSIQAAGGVRVTGGFYTGYQVTFVGNGDQPNAFTAEELFPLPSEEVVPGTSPLVTIVEREGDNLPPANEVQSFTIDPTASFQIQFGDPLDPANTTPILPPTATEADVAIALNALASIDPAQGGTGPVIVAKDPVNSRFVVTFATEQDQVGTLVVTAERQEVQEVDFYATGEIAFNFEGETTARLPHFATPLEVQNALNSLASIQATGPGGAGGAVAVTAGTNGAYIIEFNTFRDKTEITGTQFSAVPVNVTNGTALTPEVQVIAPPNRLLYNPAVVPTANFVGGIADQLALEGPNFRFIDFVSGTDPLDTVFEPSKGDVPIDGLIMARTFVQNTVNFIPEARLVAGVFYDFDNRI